jgi:hypothetical protein
MDNKEIHYEAFDRLSRAAMHGNPYAKKVFENARKSKEAEKWLASIKPIAKTSSRTNEYGFDDEEVQFLKETFAPDTHEKGGRRTRRKSTRIHKKRRNNRRRKTRRY